MKRHTQTSVISWDRGFKAFFSHAVMVESLLRSFLDKSIVDTLDFSTLQPWTSDHLTKAMQERFNDAIWRVRIRDGNWLYCYIMLEFQRKSDKTMALRIAEYSLLLIRGLYKANAVTLDADVPPILPIVINIGATPWTAPLSTAAMRPTLPTVLQRYQVQQEYILLETCRADETTAASLAEILFALCNAEPEQAPPLIDKLETVLTGERYESLRELFMQWVNVSILTPAGVTPVDTTINFKEAREMLAARVKEWEDKVRTEGFNTGIERGIEKGIEKGRIEGLMTVALNMLKKKFSFDQIADATGFSVPEVERMAAEHQLA